MSSKIKPNAVLKVRVNEKGKAEQHTSEISN